jgi:hypothetical protein
MEVNSVGTYMQRNMEQVIESVLHADGERTPADCTAADTFGVVKRKPIIQCLQ